MSLATATRPIDELRPHPNNPRNGDLEALADSLLTNGQFKPIVTTTDGTILAGNHTYAAAMELGWDSLDCVILDLDPFSDSAVRIMLADNRIGDLGRYDEALLLKLLNDLGEDAEALLGTGYATDDVLELTSLLNSLPAVGLPPSLDAMDGPHEITCPQCGHTWSRKAGQ